MEASIIGLGAEHLDGKDYDIVKETIDAAMEHGINMMDVFMPGSDIRQKIGRAIKGNRDKFIIQGHIGSTDINMQYDISRDLKVTKKYFESLLADLGTDYIDFGMLFFIDSEKDFDAVFNSDIIAYAKDLKKKGVIRAIGASSHNPVMAKKIVETGVIELLMFSINPAFDMIPAEVDALGSLAEGFDKNQMLNIDPKRQELYRTCDQLDIPITVMKPLGGGKLISKDHTPFPKPLTVGQCVHYALTRPSVASVLVGCQSRKHIEEAVSYLTAAPDDLDYTEAIRSMNESFKGSCLYCNHCLPCPAGIDIAAVTKYLDIVEKDNNAITRGAGLHYRELSAYGSDCIQCGDCERRCPFSVLIMKNMQRASELFGI
ncbi:MAG: aldo/keto reductase [Euryarchaeota archaeon]|nr:aldo/keto reductase [Euryarchaeota archaeon]